MSVLSPSLQEWRKVSAAARAAVPSRPVARGNPVALRVRAAACPTPTLL